MVGLVGGHHGTWKTGPFSLPELLSRCTLHVTSLYRRELWRQVGGYDGRFRESAEDWDLWLRCWLAGATVEAIPDAIYRAYVRPNSRNRAPQHAERIVAHRAIYEANFGVAA